MNNSYALLFGAPVDTIPTAKSTGAFKLLNILSDGQAHSRESLGESMRSPLQSLRGDRFQYWLIHSVKQDASKTTLLQLDPRHLSGDSEQDAAARLERRRQLKKDSHKQAMQEQQRLPKALAELLKAEKDYLKNLEAANDPTQECYK
ncbi:hypothetical protein GCM10009112_15670 [Marinomonas arenicola]|uniref:hypothetical protein n=1 Tax=Marinomonas TaxID=28253 RepID=UPI0010559D7D|nr:hypothetical protein [Marinomonas sp. KMM3893]